MAERDSPRAGERIQIRMGTVSDAPAIAEIYNAGIAERTATFETEPRSAAQMAERLRRCDRYPLLVAVDAAERVVGWAGLGEYRPRPCYAGVAEFSIYLAANARGRGTGTMLLNALIDVAGNRGFWKLVSRVFPFNTASRALCRGCGFREVGVYEKHSQLDGRWLDVVIVEKLLGQL